MKYYQFLSWLMKFSSIQSDFKTEPNDATLSEVEYPAKKTKKGFYIFWKFFFYLLEKKKTKKKRYIHLGIAITNFEST